MYANRYAARASSRSSPPVWRAHASSTCSSAFQSSPPSRGRSPCGGGPSMRSDRGSFHRLPRWSAYGELPSTVIDSPAKSARSRPTHRPLCTAVEDRQPRRRSPPPRSRRRRGSAALPSFWETFRQANERLASEIEFVQERRPRRRPAGGPPSPPSSGPAQSACASGAEVRARSACFFTQRGSSAGVAICSAPPSAQPLGRLRQRLGRPRILHGRNGPAPAGASASRVERSPSMESMRANDPTSVTWRSLRVRWHWIAECDHRSQRHLLRCVEQRLHGRAPRGCTSS